MQAFALIGQLGILTVAATIITAVLAHLRERASRRETRRTAIRDLLREVDGLYRSFKQIRRMLRSRECKTADGFRGLEPTFFRHSMQELSQVQLGLEQCRQLVRTMETLFATDRHSRLIVLLHYPDKYLRKVVQEFEYRKFGEAEGSYLITEKCIYFSDLLRRASYPVQIEEELRQLEVQSDEGDGSQSTESVAPLPAISGRLTPSQSQAPNAEDGYPVFLEFIQKSGEVRTRSVAAQCLRLCLRELREALQDV
jgi:hypothetical protein